MTKISNHKLPADKTAKLIDQLWRAVTLLDNKDEVHEFLHDILTRTELVMLAKRLEVVKMLEEGYTYQQIKTELSVTDSTIAKINNWYNAFGKGYQTVIDKLHRIEDKHKIKKSLLPRRKTLLGTALKVGIISLDKS